MKKSATAASAPGKVLVIGGYLVLDQRNAGLVIALPARIYAVVEKADEGIEVRSPQFKDAIWEYSCKFNGSALDMPQTSQNSANPFVYQCLLYTLNYLGPNHVGLKITILADNDYYTQSDSSPPRFNKLGVSLKDANKTGLGSSAALVTALTCAMLQFFDKDVQANKRVIHNIAQTAHCAAQGKVGSGFDVAAAVYGSCEYNRFSPETLHNIPSLGTNEYRNFMESEWDVTVVPFTLPPRSAIIMGDIKGGSSTPNMVKKMLQWRDTDTEASKMWKKLSDDNYAVITQLRQLCSYSIIHSDEYMEAAKIIGSNPISQILDIRYPVPSLAMFARIVKYGRDVRRQLREMGVKAGVEIEPSSQTPLLDACCESNGVLFAGVPGAGGNDAIFCLVVDRGREHLQRTFQEWKESHIKEIAHPSISEVGEEPTQQGVLREEVEKLLVYTR